MPSNPVPNVLTGAGFLLWAPLGTDEPDNTVTGGVFDDEWPSAWVELGATDEGKTFAYEIESEAIEVAEFFDPIKYATTRRTGTFSFALADYTAENLEIVLNGGTLDNSGGGDTALSEYEPPDPGDEVRAMIGFESEDAKLRIVCYQVLNSGTVETQFAKPPQKALLPATFQLEKPSDGPPFKKFFAGDRAANGGS